MNEGMNEGMSEPVVLLADHTTWPVDIRRKFLEAAELVRDAASWAEASKLMRVETGPLIDQIRRMETTR